MSTIDAGPRLARTSESYSDTRTKQIVADDGIAYTYREVGDGTIPLLLLQHFRGNLDNWDPALIDHLAVDRRVIAFNNVGVAGTSGTTPNSVEAMARGAIKFLEAIELEHVDLLGFSLGSFVAQEVALIRPDVVRRMILASSAPRGAAGMHGWAPDVIGAVGVPQPTPEGVLGVFFTPSPDSRTAGMAAFGRMFARTTDPDQPTSWQTRRAQYDAICTWGIPNASQLDRLNAIEIPVFVANGDSDRMILPRYSHLLAGLLPNAQLTIYPDAAHGFLFQHHIAFAADATAFLKGETDD
jgi:pimeloyl-ACP methyl ester carboxylesterase